MNKHEFINTVAEKSNQKRSDVEKTFNTFWSVIMDAIATNETVSFVGIGTFGTKQRAARIGQNPKTKEKLEIPAAIVPYFKAGNKLKLAVTKDKV